MYRLVPLLLSMALIVSAGLNAEERAEEDIIRFINTLREEAGLGSCGIEAAARDTAAAYALEIAETGRFSHTDAGGLQASGRYREAGGHALRVGEIVGAGPSTQAIMSAWKESMRHVSVILNGEWTRIGAGAARMEDGRIVAVVLFTKILYRDLAMDETEQGFLVTGRFTGEGEPAVEINGNLVMLERASDSASGFQSEYRRKYPVYLLRFGVIENGTFYASETYIFDPDSS